MAGLVLGHGKTQNTKQHVTEKNNILTAVKKSGSRNAKKEEKKEKKEKKKKKKKEKKRSQGKCSIKTFTTGRQ